MLRRFKGKNDFYALFFFFGGGGGGLLVAKISRSKYFMIFCFGSSIVYSRFVGLVGAQCFF